MVAVTPGGQRAFVEAFERLADGTGPETVRSVEDACDLELLGRGTTRLAFRTDGHVDGDTAVVKIALADQGGRRAIEREVATWGRADDAQRALLAPVVAVDPAHRWVVMPGVDVGVPPACARDFHRELTAEGLVLRDVTPGDVGDLDGDVVLVDYAGCKPVADAPVSQSEMKALVEQRWNDWE